MVNSAALQSRVEVLRRVRGRLDGLIAASLEGMRNAETADEVDAILLEQEPSVGTEDDARFDAMHDLELAKDIRQRIDPSWSERVRAEWARVADSVELTARKILALNRATLRAERLRMGE